MVCRCRCVSRDLDMRWDAVLDFSMKFQVFSECVCWWTVIVHIQWSYVGRNEHLKTFESQVTIMSYDLFHDSAFTFWISKYYTVGLTFSFCVSILLAIIPNLMIKISMPRKKFYQIHVKWFLSTRQSCSKQIYQVV